MPELEDCIQTNLKISRVTNAKARLRAISLNCRLAGTDNSGDLCRDLSSKFDVPCFTPLVYGEASFADTLK